MYHVVAYHSQSSDLIGNWNGQFRHWWSKTGGDKGMRGWLTHLQEYVLTLNMGAEAEKIPLLFWGIWGSSDGGGC